MAVRSGPLIFTTFFIVVIVIVIILRTNMMFSEANEANNVIAKEQYLQVKNPKDGTKSLVSINAKMLTDRRESPPPRFMGGLDVFAQNSHIPR